MKKPARAFRLFTTCEMLRRDAADTLRRWRRTPHLRRTLRRRVERIGPPVTGLRIVYSVADGDGTRACIETVCGQYGLQPTSSRYMGERQ